MSFGKRGAPPAGPNRTAPAVPQYMMEALEGVLYGVGVGAVVWWGIARLAGARR